MIDTMIFYFSNFPCTSLSTIYVSCFSSHKVTNFTLFWNIMPCGVFMGVGMNNSNGRKADRTYGEETETNKMQLIWCLFQTISTCFGHHYAHHQENNSVHCRIWFCALVVMAVAVWSWDVSCVHCEDYCWDSLIINIKLVASCWFLSLHPM